MNRLELEEFVCEIFDIEQITPTIHRQIQKFVTELELDYKTIARALYYLDKEKNEDFKNKLHFGIGLVPSFIKQSEAYFKKLALEMEENKKILKEQKEEKHVIIFKRKRKEKKKEVPKINLEELI